MPAVRTEPQAHEAAALRANALGAQWIGRGAPER